MSPLAQRLAKQLLTPISGREGIWRDQTNASLLRSALFDVHCFDVTAVLPLMQELVDSMHGRFGRPTSDNPCSEGSDFIGKLVFLPAPKTWIEWKHPALGYRIALLLEDQGHDTAHVSLFNEVMAANIGWVSLVSDDFRWKGGEIFVPKEFELVWGNRPETVLGGLLASSHVFLVLINSPRIIGRRQNMPHAALERRFLRGRKLVGKFPLHAWTEIMLRVTKPPEIDDGEPHEAHLTGKRALHFVRKHIRIRLGQLEYVSSHWRGDPSVGIKQSRYTVMP